MAASRKPQAEKPVSTPRQYGLPAEGESMRALQQAMAAAQLAGSGAEQVTARASRIEDALNAVARTRQAVAAARTLSVMGAQERATQAIAAAEAMLSSAARAPQVGPATPQPLSTDANPEPVDRPQGIVTQEQAMEAAQEQADRAGAVAQDAVAAIARDVQASIDLFSQTDVGDSPLAQQAMRQAAAAQERSVESAQEQVRLAMAAAVAGTEQAGRGGDTDETA